MIENESEDIWAHSILHFNRYQKKVVYCIVEYCFCHISSRHDFNFIVRRKKRWNTQWIMHVLVFISPRLTWYFCSSFLNMDPDICTSLAIRIGFFVNFLNELCCSGFFLPTKLLFYSLLQLWIFRAPCLHLSRGDAFYECFFLDTLRTLLVENNEI